MLFMQRADEAAHLRPQHRSIGIFSGAITCTSMPRARSDAATSRPMKLAPSTTTRRAARRAR